MAALVLANCELVIDGKKYAYEDGKLIPIDDITSQEIRYVDGGWYPVQGRPNFNLIAEIKVVSNGKFKVHAKSFYCETTQILNIEDEYLELELLIESARLIAADNSHGIDMGDTYVDLDYGSHEIRRHLRKGDNTYKKQIVQEKDASEIRERVTAIANIAFSKVLCGDPEVSPNLN